MGGKRRGGRKGERRGERRNAFPQLFNPTLTSDSTVASLCIIHNMHMD